MKREAVEAYRGGKEAWEKARDWKTVVIFAISFAISSLFERWFVARYPIPWFEREVLSIVFFVAVFMALISLRRKLSI